MPAKSTRSKPGRSGSTARAGKTAAKATKTARAGTRRGATKAASKGGAKTGAKSGARSAGKSAARGAKTGRAGKTAAKGASRSSKVSPGISRIDQPTTRTHGFFVRVGYERTDSGSWRPKHRAFFGDASHGGRAKAMKAAEDWLRKVKRA